MGYSGKTYQIACDEGGLVGQANVDLIAPNAMLDSTRNLNLNKDARQKRGGTAHVNASAFSGTPQVMGLYDFRLFSGTQFIITATKDGKVYKDDSNTIKTGMSTSNYFAFETFEDELFICDGETRPQTWDGAAASTSNITSIPSDWTGTNFPQWILKHGYGNSERMWAFGCPETPTTVYASANGDGNDFSDGNVITINIETADGFGLVGAIEFGDRIIAFGKNQSYVIDDTDSTPANWGYTTAQWRGGVANWKLLVKTPNDLVAMAEDGNIYSVISAQTYGDYKKASLSKPAFMDLWIQENIDLSKFAQFHANYDPNLRAIKFFMCRDGYTENNVCLCYFVDSSPAGAWMIHENRSYDSGYDASASAKIRAAAGDYQLYTGNYGGIVWKLEQTAKNDNSNAFDGRFKTPNLNFENSRTSKNFARAWVVAQPESSETDVTLDWWVDGKTQTQQIVTLAAAGAALDAFVLDTDVLGGDQIIDFPVDLKQNGRRIQFEIGNNVINQDFFISQVLVDFKPLGEEAGA